ncbi:MAG: dihydroneopterin aldolase [Bacteroidales bacterium]|nr:dihydroneopterin aldolase [Bacteroidales bacterium]
MIITIDRLKVFAHHGVLEQERRVGNTFEVTLRLYLTPGREALEGDSLSGTVNYADVIALVKEEMAIPSELIEHVAWRIGRRILDTQPLVDEVEVAVAKLCPPCGAELAGVSATLFVKRRQQSIH